MRMTKEPWFPIRTYQRTGSDPLNNITNVLSKLGVDEGAAIQIVMRPAGEGWQEKAAKMLKQFSCMRKKSLGGIFFSWIGIIFELEFGGAEDLKNNMDTNKGSTRTTPMTDDQVKAIEEKIPSKVMKPLYA